MRNNHPMSSVQALDDYFEALLDESEDSLPEAPESSDPNQQELPLDDSPVEPTDDAQSEYSNRAEHLIPERRQKSHLDALVAALPESSPILPETVFKRVAPDLSHVERLLSRLNETNDGPQLLQPDSDTDVLIADAEEERIDIAQEITAENTQLADTELGTDSDTEIASSVITNVVTEPEPQATSQTETLKSDDVMTETEEPVSAAQDEEKHLDQDVQPETEEGSDNGHPPGWKNVDLGFSFEVLFFECHGVKYAVPLAHLGGILSLGECSHLLGRPDWYIGLQTEKDQKLDVVDLAKWVMPEKITDNCHRDDYSYIVILGDSMWGLACNTLLGTETLDGEQVQWREQAGRRPWLAGLVKEQMCVLIHVEALTDMFNQGIDARALA
ncbi:chemotaxis protein CheW [Veronia pacifica]|uniref:CheW-like domain-containing protein n=1 Tax=Veronia pacifica TaxID=1080227 RepID=A0A1C3EEK5_9GAMM|nr:chemotaxis protein CheW [Veronia pacifica]ODA31624.1 hypothetical protein A8L45_16010 [Veronia pacifica]